MLTIIGPVRSINVRKVLWTCDETGLDYQREDAGPGLVALNPNALVPVIRDGDFVLWESNTICRYLARRHGRTDLLPAEPRAQAEVERWMDWQASDLNGAWRYAFMALVRRHPAYGDPAQVAASTAAWNQYLAVLDGQLAVTGAFVAGAHFTLADVVIGLSVQRWLMAPIERPALPAVQAYVTRLLERPAFVRWGPGSELT